MSRPAPSESTYRPFEALELTTLLIRQYGIHSGLWTLTVNFHTSGHNFVADRQESIVVPAVVVGVRSIGLRQVEIADPLTVDASAVNPARSR